MKMLVDQNWLNSKIKNDPDLNCEVNSKQMPIRILDRYKQVWFYQFGEMYGSLNGYVLRRADDIARRSK